LAEGWSRLEVEATVADYFDMLNSQVRGVPYNKSAHRRRLSGLLNARSDGAIERKHQNISAVLIELGFIYIEGYRPLRNYQQLLFEVVSDRLANSEHLRSLVVRAVEQPATVPTVDDILGTMVEPPTLETGYRKSGIRDRMFAKREIDYLEREARNRSLGLAGEEFVLRYETARLVASGEEGLAAQVEHVSRTQGDGLGFDILSFEVSGRERFIEVKTTAYGPMIPFFVTRNEVAASRELSQGYHLYRAFRFREGPRLYTKAGALDQSFDLDPVHYLATAL
jgi:hypothetical protein